MLAHEFGHYSGGDTRLGPWIYRTRATIVRTVQQLSDEDGDESLVAEARPPAVHLVRQRVPAHHGRDLAPPGVRRRRVRRRAASGAPPTSRRWSASTPTRPASTPTGSTRSSRCCARAGARRSPRASSASSPTSRSRRPRRTTSTSCARSRPTRTTRTRRCPSGSPRSRGCPTASRTTRRARSTRSRTRPRPSGALLEFLLGPDVAGLPEIDWDAVGTEIYGARARELTERFARRVRAA